MTEAEVRKAGSKALVATYPMSSIGRARERGPCISTRRWRNICRRCSATSSRWS